MSKQKIPVELQVILRDLCITEPDSRKLLEKVHARAAMQVKDYIHIILSKFQVGRRSDAGLRESMAETRLALMSVQQEHEGGEEQHETGVVVHE
jgi:hypothetical protein